MSGAQYVMTESLENKNPHGEGRINASTMESS